MDNGRICTGSLFSGAPETGVVYIARIPLGYAYDMCPDPSISETIKKYDKELCIKA